MWRRLVAGASVRVGHRRVDRRAGVLSQPSATDRGVSPSSAPSGSPEAPRSAPSRRYPGPRPRARDGSSGGRIPPGDILNSPQAIVDRVGVEPEPSRGGPQVPALRDDRLEGLDEWSRCGSPLIVTDNLPEPLFNIRAQALVVGDLQKKPIDPERLRPAPHRDRSLAVRERAPALLQRPGGEARPDPRRHFRSRPKTRIRPSVPARHRRPRARSARRAPGPRHPEPAGRRSSHARRPVRRALDASASVRLTRWAMGSVATARAPSGSSGAMTTAQTRPRCADRDARLSARAGRRPSCRPEPRAAHPTGRRVGAARPPPRHARA